MTSHSDAVALAQAIRKQTISASAVVQSTLDQIATLEPQLNCFSNLLSDNAMAAAYHADRTLSQRGLLGSLSGVPFAVENALAIAGQAPRFPDSDRSPAASATVINRLKQAGAILLGQLPTAEAVFEVQSEPFPPNPHALEHWGGGAGAAAIAAGLVPLSLGIDTHGEIRIAAALCGVYGFKPTYGRLPRTGVQLRSSSLDQVGYWARSVRDLATLFDFLQGPDLDDPGCSRHPPDPLQPQLSLGVQGLQIAVAGGYFQEAATAESLQAVATVARSLGANAQVILPQSDRAKAAAELIIAVEGATQHLERLRSHPDSFAPATRDRLLAGVCIPAPWYLQAQQFRGWYRDRLRELLQHVDVLLAPTTPFAALPLSQTTTQIDNQDVLLRAYLARFTQPLSLIGLPSLSVPLHRPGQLPLGVQLIAAPYKEATLVRVAAHLERQGIISAPIATVEP